MTEDEIKEKKAKIEAAHLKGVMRAAEQGSAEDQFLVGLYYKNGECGLKQDSAQAIKWFKKAAAQGDAYALFDLGMCYADGVGVKRDWKRAKQYFTEAALAVDSVEDDVTLNARDAVKMLEESEYDEMRFFSIEFYKLLSDRRAVYDIDAVRELPSWDYEKYFTVPKDYAKAINEYRRAAEQNDPYAMLRLGLCYAAGLGVDKDWEQAKQYFAASVLADSKGDDILALDAKEAYKLLFDDGNRDKPFEEILRERLEEVRMIYQGE